MLLSSCRRRRRRVCLSGSSLFSHVRFSFTSLSRNVVFRAIARIYMPTSICRTNERTLWRVVRRGYTQCDAEYRRIVRQSFLNYVRFDVVEDALLRTALDAYERLNGFISDEFLDALGYLGEAQRKRRFRRFYASPKGGRTSSRWCQRIFARPSRGRSISVFLYDRQYGQKN